LDTTVWIALGVLYLIAVADVFMSRLTTGAKILWAVLMLFLVGVGLLAWLLTRHTAHQDGFVLPNDDASVGNAPMT